ncbi:hypothetical protein PCASD_01126 [Puccinia coronata f. sp. avenae]|uniref:Restriction of telomere capping protein 4 n=1 Tax=Puccinia coronata f. sp. avenae TaxID=200324 RepID=A0A2N5VLQ7_9BASI|nr:hypothetical protein PCASD_01126 [Puccinia coronata f. sp. avenae]
MASDSLANLGFHFNFQKSPVKVKKPRHPKTSPVKVKKSWRPKTSPVKVKKTWPPKKNFSTHKINPEQSNDAITSKNSPNQPNGADHAPPNKAPSIEIPNSEKDVLLENDTSNLPISLNLHKNLEAPLPVDILKDMKAVLHSRGLQLQEDPSDAMIHPAFRGNVTMPELPEAPQKLIQASKGNLCVFCDEPMPLNPSSKLKKLGQYLQAKPKVQHRREPTNPWALHLPFPLTASYCQMHQAELNIIPHGLAKQWPSTIDFENLSRRVEHLRDHLLSIFNKQVPSCYMDRAINSWITLGKHKSQSLFYDINLFELEQPGYYGVQGFQKIYNTLHRMFLSSTTLEHTTQLAHPVSAEFLVRKVLIPETARSLIAKDIKTYPSDPQVQQTLEESRAFGAAMFPDED